MTRHFARFLGLALLIVTAACSGRGGGSDVPPIEFSERVLENGLRVITSRDISTPNVTVQVWYQVGSKDDPLGRSGFAHLFEHMMFKATTNMPNETLDRFTEDVGGFNNASTWDDFTNYYEVVPAGHLERILWAEAERMSSLVIDEANFESERDVVKEELRQRILADPYGRLFGLMMVQATYKEHPYRRPGIGSIEELDAATLDDVRAFHRDFYRPDNAALIVVGNFDPAKLDEWIEKYFGPIEKPAAPIKRVDVAEPARTQAGIFDGFGPNVPLPALAVTWLGPKADDPDAAALKVLDAILSSGRSSRLYNALVYDQKIANEAFSLAELPANPGYVGVGAIMASGHTIEEGEAALLAEVKKLRETAPTDAELSEAKNELITDKLRERETIDGRGFALGYALMIEGSAARANDELDALRAVTAEDVQRVAAKYLADDKRMTIRYRPESEMPAGYVSPVPPAPQVASVRFDGPVFALAAEGEREAPPAVAEAINPTLPQPQEKTLANGLRVVVAESSSLPLVSAQLTVKAGAWADPQQMSGVTAMTAWMLTEGTTTRSATEIASQTEALGANLGSTGATESAQVTLNVMPSNLEAAMAIMADVARNPAFADEEVERQRAQMLDTLQVEYQDPAALAAQTANPLIFAGTPLGHVTGGTPASLRRIASADLKRVHQTYYRPDNAVLVLTGDISPSEGFALAEKAFGDWAKPSNPLPAPPLVTAAPVRRAVVIDLPGTGQAAVSVLGPAISRTDPAYFPAIVTNSILGSGYSSRLNQEIRIKRGLSYGASSSIGALRSTGAFTARAQTKNESAGEVLGLIETELTRLGTEPVSETEMTARKSVVIGNFGRRLETTSGLASFLAELSLYDLPLDEVGAYTGKVDAVTPEQVQTFARTTLDPARASILIAGDASMMLPAVRSRVPTVEVVPAAAIDLDSPTLRAQAAAAGP